MAMQDVPLTAEDLRRIADATEAVDNTKDLAVHDVLGRFEVFRPDGDDRIGWVQRFDGADMGWGFVPVTEEER